MTPERKELEALFAIGEQSAAELAAQHKPVCTVIDEALSDGTTRVRLSPEFRGRLRYGTQLYAALEQPGVGPVDRIEQIAQERYKVVPSHNSMFYRFAVVAGSGAQQLYLGRETECQNMARKFAGCFLDGAFFAAQSTAPQPAQQPFPESVAEVESTLPDADALLNENRVLRESLERCKKVGSATASCWDDDKKDADALLRQALEAMEVQGSEWVILERNAIAAIRKYLGES